MNNEKKKEEQGGHFIDALCRFLLEITEMNLKIFSRGFSRIELKSVLSDLFILSTMACSLSLNPLHLQFLHWLSPDIFSDKLMGKIHNLNFMDKFIVLMILFSGGFIWIKGFIHIIRTRGPQKALDSIGLKNGLGETAKVVDVVDLETDQKLVIVNSQGIGQDKFLKSKEALESAFNIPIEQIRYGSSMKYTEIVLGLTPFPDHISFGDFENELCRDGEFFIGRTKDKILKENICNLPHMLIAGSTGGGKSVFFKQILAGLLKSTDHLQMYLIDLKGGLEFRPFMDMPNVRVVKTMEDAVALLKAVKDEMEARFVHLEKMGREKIDPKRDRIDRIIVGIDEASVLYGNVSRESEDYELVVKARHLTEHIAKLARAASIHLILATQKVTKETIDTRIQENISGRMCFKLNTLEGSLRVLGNGKACDLPNIPGRGIWQLGHETREVQAPDVDRGYLIERLGLMEADHELGKKKMFQTMLVEEEMHFPVQNGTPKSKHQGDFDDL